MIRTIAYWILTALVALGSAMSGFLMVTGGMAENIAHMSFPEWFPLLLGSWKLLGAVALLTPAFAPWVSRVKEWAYAGFFFTFTGAAASHLGAGDDVFSVIAPAIFTALLIGSYALRADRPAFSEGAAARMAA